MRQIPKQQFFGLRVRIRVITLGSNVKPNQTGEKYYVRAHPIGGECYLRVEVAGGQNYGEDNVCDEKWHHCAVIFPKGSKVVKDHDLYVDGKLQTKQGNNQVMETNNKTQEVIMGVFFAHHTFMFGFLMRLLFLT